MFNVLYPNRWFIWAVVACLVVGVFVWWQIELYSLDQELASQWTQEPIRKTSLSAVDTSTWKTYRNEKYGFEFQYPAKLVASELNSPPEAKFAVMLDGFEKHDISFEVYEKAPSQSLEEWLVHRLKPGSSVKTILGLQKLWFPDMNVSIEPIHIAGLDGFRLSGGVEGIGESIYLNGVDNKTIYALGIFAYGNSSTEYFSNFEEIVNTLKFFRLVDTSTWKTYRNEKYGFEFKYPATASASSPNTNDRSDVIAHLSLHRGQGPEKLVHVRRILKAPTLQDALIEDVTYDASGFHPESFRSFQDEAIGPRSFYFIQTGLFEGLLSAAYYYPRENDVLVFELRSYGVDWMNPEYDALGDSGYLALKQVLVTLATY